MFEPSDSSPGAGAAERPRTGGAIVRHTPADIRQRRFAAALRGFERTAVLMFLTEVSDDLEQALHEIHALERELGRMEELLTEHRGREQTLRDTLLTAQKLSDEIRTTAEREGRGIIRDAESRADLLIEKARVRAGDVEREIEQLREKRGDVEREVESAIASLQATLDAVRTRDRQEREDRIRLLRPRHTEGATEPPSAARRRDGEP